MGSDRTITSTTKRRIPAVEGFFTMDDEPSLIGGRLESGGYCFPRHLGGSDPRLSPGEVEEVLLSRRGRIWSFTNSAYPPPPPFIVTEPYVPVVIAAVELELERMVVLGQVVPGYSEDELEVGMEVELELGVLYEDDEAEYLTWQWRPVNMANGSPADTSPLEGEGQ
ncbi:MAG: OB-fold domain-containing protein [Actinomycetota bacterium]|nr:OB-fold domain-containing protein [Actinomycetota bacterium]MEC9467588.1 OB-fold domain-containing protein [Actinomycetota bacterium]MED6328161.1 OB-fold domain-containing protein [Actinomycetota bacterium]